MMEDQDIWQEFFKDNNGIVFLVVRPDKTVHLKTSIHDLNELKSIFTTAYMMATLHDVKRSDYGLDNLH